MYVSKGKQHAQDRSQVPVGMTLSDVQKFKASDSGIGYFEVGNYEPTPSIPGLNFVDSAEADKPKSKSKKSKSKAKEGGDNTNNAGGNSSGTTVPPSSTTSSSQQQTDPSKRLRNLKKRLKEIEALEQKIASGELKSPEKEQVWNEYVYKMNSLDQL